MTALSIAATGMLAQQTNVEVIANNIANMNTTAFKRQRAEFQDLLYQDVKQVGAQSSDAGTIVPSGIQLGTGVRVGTVYRVTEQGTLISTGNSLDLAVSGRGFFRIQLPSGIDAFTRAGSFQLGPQGEIVTQEGYIVQPALTVPEDAVQIDINPQGELSVRMSQQTTPQILGRFELVIFANDAGLQATGDNLFLETPASGNPNIGTPDTPGFGTIIQGFLETSNVNAVTEITNLITAQRAYEMNSRVIATADEMLNAANQLR